MDLISIVVFIWDAITWVFTCEERLALLMAEHGIDTMDQILILVGVNSLMIAAEVGFFILCSKIKYFRNIKTPEILKKLTHGKPLSYQDLFIFGFTPGMQKFGSLGFVARRSQLGFRGYLSLCLGGMCRVATYPFLGPIIWVLISALVIVRVFYWLRDGVNNANR